MGKTHRFWDWIAKRYARQPVADEESYRRKLEITRAYLRPGMEVLEVGCGTGTTALIHAPFVKHIRAVDISARMLEIARAKATEQGINNVTFEQADIDDLDAVDGAYDAVMAHSILHLLEERDAAIATIHRLLKPGGLFISSTACLGDRLRLLRPLLQISCALGLLPKVEFFTVEALTSSIARAGFRIDHQWQPAEDKAVFIVAVKT